MATIHSYSYMVLLTENQQNVLENICARWEAGESLPSCREIATRFGWSSPRAATDVINALKRKGYLASDSGSTRNYRLTEKARGMPIVGQIPAGYPMDTVGNEDDHFSLNAFAFGIRDRSSAFFLRVRGDSMNGRLIFDGDLVLVEKSAEPRHEHIVAALIDQEVTLKTFIRDRGKNWLRSENPNYPDLMPLQDLQIQGVARGVIRPLKS